MRFLSYLILFTVYGISLSHSQTVELIITQTHSYCGGAEPTPDILERLRTPAPFEGKTIHLRKGNFNCIHKKIFATATMGATGIISLNLPLGTYSVVGDDKKDKKKYRFFLKRFATASASRSAIDKPCLNDWLKQPEAIIEVKEGENRFTINFHHRCDWDAIPCSSYSGPLPP